MKPAVPQVAETPDPRVVGGAGEGDFQLPATAMRRFRPKASLLVVTLAAVSVVVLIAIMFSGISDELVAVTAICLMLLLLVFRVPIGAAMGVAGMLGVWALASTRTLSRTLIDVPYSGAASWALSVIPMFVFMGLLLWRCGATSRIYDASRTWLNWMPGSLAMTTNFAGAGLAAASGSTIGIAYALGRIGIPEMLRSGYDRRLALGSVIMAGLPGQLIPPSLLLVVYAGVANLPVGPQLLAGVLPGILLVVLIGLVIAALTTLFPRLAPRDGAAVTWRGRGRSAMRVWPMPVLIVVIIWGLYGGIFTATEAAAVGAIGATAIAAGYLRGKAFLRAVGAALVGTVASVGSIFFIMIGAGLLNRLMAMSGVPTLLTQTIQDWGLTRLQFILAVLAVLLILGMFMDPISMLLLSVPILLPALVAYEVNLVWFGVIAVIMAEIGMLTPPVGVLVFVIYKIVQERDVNLGMNLTLGDTYKAALIGAPIALAVAAFLIAFPDIALWLPESSSAR